MDKPPVWMWVFVVGGVVLCGVLAYTPIGVPGVEPLVFHKLFWAAVYAHLIDAVVVAVMAQRAGVAPFPWAIQTAFLGSFSIQSFLKSQGSERNAVLPGFSLFFAVLVLLWLV